MATEATADRLLVKRLLRGDERAFEEFFSTYFPRLYRFALVRTGHDPDAAEEVVQATLVQVVRKLETYRGPEETTLRTSILDQQVVDTYNRKLVRVNDLHFLKVDDDLKNIQNSIKAFEDRDMDGDDTDES